MASISCLKEGMPSIKHVVCNLTIWKHNTRKKREQKVHDLWWQGFLTWCKEARNNLLIRAIGTKVENKSNQFTHRIRKKGCIISKVMPWKLYDGNSGKLVMSTDFNIIKMEIWLFGQLHLEQWLHISWTKELNLYASRLCTTSMERQARFWIVKWKLHIFLQNVTTASNN